jgi:hypothetical protein
MIQVGNTCFAMVKLEIQLVFLFRLCDIYLSVKLKCSAEAQGPRLVTVLIPDSHRRQYYLSLEL